MPNETDLDLTYLDGCEPFIMNHPHFPSIIATFSTAREIKEDEFLGVFTDIADYLSGQIFNYEQDKTNARTCHFAFNDKPVHMYYPIYISHSRNTDGRSYYTIR